MDQFTIRQQQIMWKTKVILSHSIIAASLLRPHSDIAERRIAWNIPLSLSNGTMFFPYSYILHIREEVLDVCSKN